LKRGHSVLIRIFLENGVVVGLIFFLDAVGPQDQPGMWASGHNGDIRRAAHGYEATRECEGGIRQELAQKLRPRAISFSSA
jgi:hypothetical protein